MFANLVTGAPPAKAAVTSNGFMVGSSGGGNLQARIVRGCHLQLGPAAFNRFDALVIPYDHRLIEKFDRPIVGGLGWSMFYNVLLTVDDDGRRVTVAAGSLPPPNGSDVLPMRVDEDAGRVSIPITLAGRPMWVLVDTCAGPPKNLSVTEVAAADLAWVRPPTTQTTTYIDGPRATRSGWVDGELKIGRFVFDKPRVAVESGPIGILGWPTLRHFRVTFDVANKRLRLDGPVDAAPGRDRIRGEGYFDTGGERPRDPRHPRWFVVAPAAAAKGLRLSFDRGAAVLTRAGRVLVIHPSGVLTELGGRDHRYHVAAGGVSTDGTDCWVARWYERSPRPGDPAPRAALLNPNGTTEDRSTDPATGVTTVVATSGQTIVERPDGSTRTTLSDGVVLDWAATGTITVSWPDPPATTPTTTPAAR